MAVISWEQDGLPGWGDKWLLSKHGNLSLIPGIHVKAGCGTWLDPSTKAAEAGGFQSFLA